MSDARESFSATLMQWGGSLLLVLLGFGLTQLLGYRGSNED